MEVGEVKYHQKEITESWRGRWETGKHSDYRKLQRITHTHSRTHHKQINREKTVVSPSHFHENFKTLHPIKGQLQTLDDLHLIFFCNDCSILFLLINCYKYTYNVCLASMTSQE